MIRRVLPILYNTKSELVKRFCIFYKRIHRIHNLDFQNLRNCATI